MNFPQFETGRLILRQFSDDDLNDVFKGLSHPEVIRYYGVKYNSREETQKQMQWFKELEEKQTGIWWAITDAAERNFMGACGLNQIHPEFRKAEIGFWLLPEYWGKGIIAETLPLVCNYGFNTIGLHRIEAFVETENVNSRHTLAKMGFIHEGTMRDAELKDGKFISLEIHALIQ
ncbi:MAG: GNAT family N-acetyltransferase [Chitinophagaceae bacterium]|nr:GNAT family N-acetyltransferase [Chitinophagaceae bacterium]MCZ2395521.1 GNAT family N-acetyltransferase [Chitinophagales bacterium]